LQKVFVTDILKEKFERRGFILKKFFATILVSVAILVAGCKKKVEEVKKISEPVEVEKNISVPKKLATENLIIFSTPEKYSYDNLVSDIEKIKMLCPQVQVKSLGDTFDGRKVFDIVIGDLSCDKQILIFGAMHAREYITTQIVMRQLCDTLDALNGFGGNYKSISTAELLQGVTIHFVPMSNPDGVSISQFGLQGVKNPELRTKISAMSNNLTEWKANAAGVDLNRNFDAGWQEFYGSPSPSSERYKGAFPGSEPEAAALINLVNQYPIKRTISYHTCGALIYWYYKQSGNVLTKSKKFANTISRETGYYLDSDYTAVDAAGFKDWAVYKKGIPSITIETGAETGGIVGVVPVGRFPEMWNRNKNVVYATIYNLKFE